MSACEFGGAAEAGVDAQQARELLGVGPEAGRAEIRQAYDLARERAATQTSPVKSYAAIIELNAALAVLDKDDGPSAPGRVRLPSRRSFVWGGLAAAAAAGIGAFVYDKVTAPGPPPGLLATLDQSAIAPLSGIVSSLAFSPDGRTLAASAGGIGASTSTGGGFLWNVSDAGHASFLSQLTDQYVSGVTYSPDNKSVAGLVDIRGTLTVWDARTGRQTLSLDTSATDPGAALECAAFSADAKFVACGSQSGDIHLVNLANHSDLVVPSGIAAQVGWLAFRSDGTLAFLDSQDSTLRFVPLGGVAPPNPVPLPNSPYGNTMSPNGASMASIAADGGIAVTNLTTAKTTVTGHVPTGQGRTAAFSPDTGTLAETTDDPTGPRYTLKVWNVPTGRQTLTLTGQWPGSTSGVISLAINYAGTIAAVGNDQGIIQLWDISKRN